MPYRIVEKNVLMFVSDINNIDTSMFLDFVSTLTYFELGVLKVFLKTSCICDYKMFSDIYLKFYTFKRK